MTLITLTRALRREHDDWRDPESGKPFVIHGLRSSFRSWAQFHRKDREIAELVLGPPVLRSGGARIRQRRSSRRASPHARHMGATLRRPERRGHPAPARMMARKSKADIRTGGWLATPRSCRPKRDHSIRPRPTLPGMRQPFGEEATLPRVLRRQRSHSCSAPCSHTTAMNTRISRPREPCPKRSDARQICPPAKRSHGLLSVRGGAVMNEAGLDHRCRGVCLLRRSCRLAADYSDDCGRAWVFDGRTIGIRRSGTKAATDRSNFLKVFKRRCP